jgi:hypothetical protein
MNKVIKFIALALAVGSLTTLAACSSSSASSATSANWNERVIKNDLTDSSEWFTKKEVATYSIDFTEGTNSSYSINYITDGSKTAEYKTEFYALSYDWNNSNLPDDYKIAGAKDNVYVYTTSLTISGTYKMKDSDDSYAFDDSIQTISYFRSAKDNLQPVYSKQVVKSTSPASLVADNLESTYVVMNNTYETFYNRSASQATVKTYDSANALTDTKQVAISSSYNVFDTTYLATAMRSFTITSSSTLVFDVMVPINGELATYQAAGSASAQLNSENADEKQIINALNSASPEDYIFASTDDSGNKVYNYSAATLSLVASLPGPSYTYWYATVPNNSFNSARAVMLKVSSPIYFSLGTLTYTLSSLSQVTIEK